MKLSLNEKTLIIIGIFAICLLFLNNLNNDDKNFTKNIIEEESRDLFEDTSSGNKNNETNNKPDEEELEELEEVKQVEEKKERETAMAKYNILIKNNENKVQGIKLQSDKYIEDIQKLHDRNKEEKDKIQESIKANLITGESIIKDKDGNDTIKSFDSYLQYNGTLLRNSLLNTASTF